MAAAVRIADYTDILRGHCVPHLVGKCSKPATMPLTIPVLRVLEVCRGERTHISPHSLRHAAICPGTGPWTHRDAAGRADGRDRPRGRRPDHRAGQAHRAQGRTVVVDHKMHVVDNLVHQVTVMLSGVAGHLRAGAH